MADTAAQGPTGAPPPIGAEAARREEAALQGAVELPTVSARTPLDWALEGATTAILAGEVLVVGLGVISRYVFNSPISWTEEIARLLLVWLMFAGGVIAMKRAEHTRVTALIRLLPEDVRIAVDLGMNAVLLVFLAVLGYQAYLLTLASRGELLPASQISGIWLNGSMPIAIVLMLFFLARQMLLEGRLAIRSPRGIAIAALTVVVTVASVLVPLLAEATPILTLVLGFVLTGALGMPIAFALGLVSLTYLVGIGGVPLTILPIRILGGVDSFVLLAIPLFILGGALMETGGISQRIVDFATAMVGHVRGGLAMVVVVAEMLFSGISGSTAADVSAISSLMVPSMKRAGYSGEESVSIVASATAMGILVPPCLTMVVLGSLANLSIVTLFLAGFIPAFVMAGVLMLVIAVRARMQGWPTASRASLEHFLQAGRNAAIPLGMPVIIFGGIFSGIVTVTEAALIAVVYAFVVGVFLYREMAMSELPRLFVGSGAVTAMTLWVLATASVFAWILAREQVPQLFAAWVQTLGGGPTLFMALTMAIFVVIGALLEGLPALLIFGPILFPIAQSIGIDPIHYGTVIVASMGIAFFLPPVGVGLYIACGIGHVDVNDAIPKYLPYLAALLVGLAIIAFVPFFTLILPELVQGYRPR
ncbi:MAG: TRAP transporter large permease subunit [Chloroflexi bacterium]|nr:TRAP transporter large permease subunit [Chloroflexota bacterium]